MTGGEVRQGIHFDMNTKALQIYYPKSAWRAAYDDVRKFFEQNGFEHEQDSGYHSIHPMTQSDAMVIMADMRAAFPWLNKCVKICTIADVPTTYDLTPLFDKNVDIPERDTRNMQERFSAAKEEAARRAKQRTSKSTKNKEAER